MVSSLVHLQPFPDVTLLHSDDALIEKMELTRDACNAALAIRNRQLLRVRQPLASLTIVSPHASQLNDEELIALIKDEVNVKEVFFSDKIETVARYSLKIHFPILGKRLAHKMKQIIPASKQGKWSQDDEGRVHVCDECLQDDEYELLLQPLNPENSEPLPSKNALAVLDVTLNEALICEGYARDVIRLIQQSRKEASLQITDHILLQISSPCEKLQESVKLFEEHICQQTLADSLSIVASVTQDVANKAPHHFDYTIEDRPLQVAFNVA